MFFVFGQVCDPYGETGPVVGQACDPYVKTDLVGQACDSYVNTDVRIDLYMIISFLIWSLLCLSKGYESITYCLLMNSIIYL